MFKARDVIRLVEQDGWHRTLSHRHYQHPSKPGNVTMERWAVDVAKATQNGPGIAGTEFASIPAKGSAVRTASLLRL